MMKVWKLKIFGTSLIYTSIEDLINSLACDIAEFEGSKEITITPFEMSEDEYDELDDFEGY